MDNPGSKPEFIRIRFVPKALGFTHIEINSPKFDL